MHKFALFILAQFIILINGYAALPETQHSDNLSVTGVTGHVALAEYFRGEQVFHADPAHLYGWKQRSAFDKTDLTEEEEEASSSKKQGKDLHPASGFHAAQTVHCSGAALSIVPIGRSSGHISCKRYILFEVFRI